MIKHKNSVKKRLIRSVLLISALIAILITVVETYTTYKGNFSQIEEVDKRIRTVFLPILATDVWNLDRDDILSEMSLILSQPAVELVQLRIDQSETLKIGHSASDKIRVFTYKLTHKHNNNQLEIGTLFVTAGLDNLYEQTRTQTVVHFLGNSVIVFLASFLVVLLTRNYITRHLVDISQILSNPKFRNDENKYLTLNRKPSIHNKEDELDNVVTAINEMITSLLYR